MKVDVLKGTDYNNKQELKYHKDCSDWWATKGGFPQIAFYLMLEENGDLSETGWVREERLDNGAHGAKWFKTKKEAQDGKIFNK